MWLINTYTLKLHYFHEPPYSDYAILSHTWIEGQEVTIQEWSTIHGSKKLGFQKIVSMCRQARNDGLSWAWVDTCCINKESSVELSEAINSMWTWYRNSRICYVYMQDVDGDCPGLQDIDDRFGDVKGWTSWHAMLWQSRWFTRGWTLQELLAPTTLAFFGRHWNEIGTKASLLTTIHRRTNIDKAALHDCDSIWQIAIARRMSWAARRETKRIEDRAYALLGIFGGVYWKTLKGSPLRLNMPLLYGEGERAFLRLQEEIIKSSLDHSIFAWSAKQPGSIPFTHDTLFAMSPDAFISCNTIERVTRPEGQRPFRVDNRGLFFEALPISRVSGADGRHLAILDCMYENDPRGRLALEVVAQYSSGLEEDNIYYLDQSKAHRRPEVCDEYGDNLEPPVVQRLTLLRHFPMARVSRFGQVSKHLIRPRVRLCLPRFTTGVVEFLDAYPHSSWDQSTMVCSLPRPSKDDIREIDVSAHLRDRVTHTAFSLAITVPHSMDPHYDLGLKMAITTLGMPETRQKLSAARPHSTLQETMENEQQVPILVKVARAYAIARDPYSGVVEIEISVGQPLPQLIVSSPGSLQAATPVNDLTADPSIIKRPETENGVAALDLFDIWL